MVGVRVHLRPRTAVLPRCTPPHAHFPERHDWTSADMLRAVRYERGSLSFETDYVRGRLMKANVTIRPDGSFSLDNQQPRGGSDAMDPPAAGQEDSGFGQSPRAADGTTTITKQKEE